MRVLDACCGIGGGARGYQLAGHEVTGVDVAKQPDYPGKFLHGDVLHLLRFFNSRLAERYDAIHASFPCTGYSAPSVGTNAVRGNSHPRLVDVGRELLEATGLPYVLENVAGSPVRKDLMLCGEMFRDPADDGPAIIGHRWFEFGGGWPVPTGPRHPAHRGYVRGWRHGVYREGPYVAAYGSGGGKASVEEMRHAKGITWSRDHLGLRDALPVAYGLFLGHSLADLPLRVDRPV